MLLAYIPLAIYTIVMVVLAVFDLKKHVLPNVIIYPTTLLAITLAIFLPGPGVAKALFGGVISLIVIIIASKVMAVGGGDIKVMGMVGFMLGWPWMLPALGGSFIVGFLVEFVFCNFVDKKRKKRLIPATGYLAISTITVFAWLAFNYYASSVTV